MVEIALIRPDMSEPWIIDAYAYFPDPNAYFPELRCVLPNPPMRTSHTPNAYFPSKLYGGWIEIDTSL